MNMHKLNFFKLFLFLIFSFLIGACSFTKKIKDGSTAFELHQYSLAVDLLQKEYQESSDPLSKARIAFTVGESYWKMGEIDQALPWYEKAILNNYGPRAIEKKAQSLKYLQQYNLATAEFSKLLQIGDQKDYYRKEIAICRLASDWINSKNKKYTIEKSLFNSKSSDYSPFFLNDHQIFFSSDRNNESSVSKYNWTGRDFADIYTYNSNSGIVSHLDPQINSEHNEGTMSLNEDGTSLFFTRCFADEEYDDYCKILVSNLVQGSWTEPIILPFIENGFNYGHPWWNERDSVLFFSAQLNSGYGGFDIYFAKLRSNGAWDQPISLGPIINTDRDEKFPSLKNDTLYFSSDGHLGMGGLDIFYSFIGTNAKWDVPTNLKSPINSGADDFGIAFEPNPFGPLDQGLFTSSRSGQDDIYSFERNRIVIKENDKIDTILEQSNLGLRLAVTVVKENPDGSKSIFPDANLLVNNSSEKLNSKGFYLQEITEGNYIISASYPGYFSFKVEFTALLSDVPYNEKLYIYNKTILLKPIELDKEIVLENIFYDFNKSFIRDDAKPSLNGLTGILLENPQIKIELSSHTDCRGPDKYNFKLSQDRAQSAVDYIIKSGINPQRIIAKGYGETIPKAICDCDSCSEEEHQLNRRTSFKIIDF